MYFCRPILKQRNMKHKIVLLVAMFAMIIPHSCNIEKRNETTEVETNVLAYNSLNEIRKRGKLIAATDYNSTNYFIYRGEPAGYEYEMLKAFAEHLGVELELKVRHDFDQAREYLVKREVDLIAMGLTINSQRKLHIDFANPMGETHQVLVQRKAKDARQSLIRNPLDLAGKIVYIPRNSSFANRLKNLQQEIGDTITIVEFPQTTDRLIEMVAKGEIDYTISDEHTARVHQKYFREIDIETPVSFPQHYAWAVNYGDDSLKNAINEWIDDFKNSKIARFIYNKYFVNPRSIQYAHEYYSARSGKISGWDEVIKEKSRELDWDWRLVASLMYQESRFQPNAKSWMGAFGLMQLMPGTAELFGVNQSSPPEENIQAGINYLKMLDQRFKNIVTDPEERKKFVLAAYNAGIAHVFDARRLAEKYGRDPNIWENNVDYYLLKKSEPEFYNDSVVYYGYCRGEEPFNYVNDILYRYEHYLKVISD
jgi:membrane-bound lytic murein transglycosylase F